MSSNIINASNVRKRLYVIRILASHQDLIYFQFYVMLLHAHKLGALDSGFKGRIVASLRKINIIRWVRIVKASSRHLNALI